MAGLTKEQRAQREAAKLAATDEQLNPAPQELELLIMVRDEPEFPDGPLSADVHPDEVDNWQLLGWRLED
jgi:hypothetical protein